MFASHKKIRRRKEGGRSEARSGKNTGITNDLRRRIREHKSRFTPGFTSRYNVTRLVYFEEFVDVLDAIAREKQIKAWTRARRVGLIERGNPHWRDLADGWA